MQDKDYFHQRAVAERRAATRARSMPSFRAHMDMVREYDRRVFELGRLAA
jgi:hypothetical protein